jgi:hypothetical protein
VAARLHNLQRHSLVSQEPKRPAGVAVRWCTAPEGHQPGLPLAIQPRGTGGLGLWLSVECRLKPLFDPTLSATQDGIDTDGEALGDPRIRPGRTSCIRFQQAMGMADLGSGRFAFPRQLRQLGAFCIGKTYNVLFVHDTRRLIARSALRRHHNRLPSKNKADKALGRGGRTLLTKPS